MMTNFDIATWRTARRALEEAVALHLHDPNVPHLDLGYRIHSSAGNRLVPELAVRVHVRRKLHGQEYEAFAQRCPLRVITATRIGFAVDIVPATYHLDREAEPATFLNEHIPFDAESHHKASSHESREMNTGICGGQVRHRHSGELMMLSTWHVLSRYWNPKPELATKKIPMAKEWSDEEHLAEGYVCHALGANLDAALIRYNNRELFAKQPMHTSVATGMSVPQIGMKVMKCGGRTEVTYGTITGILGHGIHSYDGSPRVIGNIVHIAPEELGEAICAPGDSGSWWLECSTRRAVALHFASSISPNYALALSLPEVLNALDAEIIPAEETLPHQQGFVSTVSTPEITDWSADVTCCTPQPHHIRLIHLLVFAAILTMSIVMFVTFGLQLFIVHHGQEERISLLQHYLARLQYAAEVDGIRRYRLSKILVIIDRHNPGMNSSIKLRIAEEIYAMSRKYGNLEVELICATITQESGWKPEAVSATRALGLMQILPSTGVALAREEGIRWNSAQDALFNPIYNIRLGCRYLSGLVQEYDIDAGLAAYNGGEKTAQRWLHSGRANGILQTETASYVPAVLKIYEKYQRMPH